MTKVALQKRRPFADGRARLRLGREAGMSCTGCANADLIAIRMRIGGEELVFRRCNKCELNHWENSVGEISLVDVLELARPAV